MMKRFIRAVALLGVAALLLAGFAAGLSRAVYGRSLGATLYEYRLRRQHAHPRSAEAEDARLEALREAAEPRYSVPEDLQLGAVVSMDDRDGMQVFTLNPGGGAVTVLYLHGGAYVNGFNAHQWRFLDGLASAVGCEIVAPDYHLIPYGDCDRAYGDLAGFYRDWVAAHPGRRLMLMGDSAGGGLALGLAKYLVYAGDPLPERLILLSPWVDVSMDNPEAEAMQGVEPMLHLDLMRVHGKWWAGTRDVHDWQVSPLYGDMAGLPPVTLYCGTRELLYPDILLTRDRLEAAGVTVDLHVGKGLNHDYPLMPIPEARRAREEIASLVRG